MLYHIVATDKNGVIGKDNKIPWNILEDMKHFRKTTNGNVIVMGRKTADSIGRKLPNRHNIVITKSKDYCYPNGDIPDESSLTLMNVFDGNVEKYLKFVSDYNCFLDKSRNNIYIIGGQSIYEATKDFVDGIIMTGIDIEVEGDAYYQLPDRKPLKISTKRLSDRATVSTFIYRND